MSPSSDTGDDTPIPRPVEPPSGAADGRDDGDGPAVPRPIPVRPPGAPAGSGDAGGGDDAGGDGEEGGGARSRAARPTTPRPVRAGLGSDEPEAAPVAVVEPPEVTLELPDGELTVRVRGRSRGHTSQGVADLLLLGFHRAGEDEPAREALVVGRSLEALSRHELETAWRRSRESRDPFEPAELFPGTRRSRGRGRGR